MFTVRLTAFNVIIIYCKLGCGPAAAPNRVKTDLLSSDWRISVQGSAASCRQGWQAENDGHCEIKLFGSCEDGRLDRNYQIVNCEEEFNDSPLLYEIAVGILGFPDPEPTVREGYN